MNTQQTPRQIAEGVLERGLRKMYPDVPEQEWIGAFELAAQEKGAYDALLTEMATEIERLQPLALEFDGPEEPEANKPAVVIAQINERIFIDTAWYSSEDSEWIIIYEPNLLAAFTAWQSRRGA